MKPTRINHASAHCLNPQKTSEDFAYLVGGYSKPLPWKENSYATLFNSESWSSDLIEFFDRSVSIQAGKDGPVFVESPASPYCNATHFNISVAFTREQIEERAAYLGLKFSWRDSMGFLDVWLDKQLLIEFVCTQKQ